jgi:hypothetical protein
MLHQGGISLQGIRLDFPLTAVLGQWSRGGHHVLEIALVTEMLQEETI